MWRKQLVSVFLNRQNILTGASGGFVLIVIGLFTFTILGPLFIGKSPGTSKMKDITVVIPNGGVEIAASSLKTSGFRKIYAISYDESVSSHSQFKSMRQLRGTFGGHIQHLINTSYVLFAGPESFRIPSSLPRLPDKPMVIGYSFAQCYEKGFGLLLPTQLEYSLITKEALHRFSDFGTGVLNQPRLGSAEFRTFCDFHSLHLLLMPCGKVPRSLPKWESIDVVEYPNEHPLKPWDSLPMFEEIWTVRDLL
jgi:hypothetical protein